MLAVSSYLVGPELFPRRRPPEKTASVTMPETSVHKDYCMIFRKNDVRFAGELDAMKPIPIPLGKQTLPDE